MRIADFHIHSKYARGTSKFMDLDALAAGAKIKGIDILGTGDFTHPKWLQELKHKLGEKTEGVYHYKGIDFVLSTEFAVIYKDQGRTRKIHHILLAPDLAAVDQINAWLDTKGRRDYDGRPIFGFTSVELVEAMRNISADIEIIPAHAWTPWFSVFGSLSGYDSLRDCFQDQTRHIHAIETGMSSDPAMNWRLKQLDDITLVSNSDAHSAQPWRLGREANVFDLRDDFTFRQFLEPIRTRKRFSFTIETSCCYGKYHFDGHRNCNVSLHPADARKQNNLCHSCKKPLTIGVLHRVEELADRPEGFRPPGSVDFHCVLPLHELIAFSVGQGLGTKKVAGVHQRLLGAFGNEFNILLDVPEEDLTKSVGNELTQLILLNRRGELEVEPGYDGVYGTIKVAGNR